MTLGSAPKSASTVELGLKESTQLRIENEIDASLESVPPIVLLISSRNWNLR